MKINFKDVTLFFLIFFFSAVSSMVVHETVHMFTMKGKMGEICFLGYKPVGKLTAAGWYAPNYRHPVNGTHFLFGMSRGQGEMLAYSAQAFYFGVVFSNILRFFFESEDEEELKGN